MDIVERLNGPIADAVHRLCRGSWRRNGEVLEDKDRPKFSIPASYERDSDLIATQGVKEAAAEITRLRARIVEAEAVIGPFAEVINREVVQAHLSGRVSGEDKILVKIKHFDAAARWMEGKADATDELRKAKADAWDEAMNVALGVLPVPLDWLWNSKVDQSAVTKECAAAIRDLVNPYRSKT